MADLFERYAVIDVDTHLTEPPDLWTSRVASKWGDAVPHIERWGEKDMWVINGRAAGAPGAYTMAGFDGVFPDKYRDTWADLPASAYDAKARLEFMDREGIRAQVLYPNVAGFGSGRFLKLGEPQLMLDCVRAYNDFLLEWTREDPDRLIPVMSTPFWDIAETVREIERCAEGGHKAVLACSQPQDFGQPALRNCYWDPMWAAAQDAGLSISFHIGGGDDPKELLRDQDNIGIQANFARVSSLMIQENKRCIADIIFSGICHRFPDLKFVSVESGVGWIQYSLESFDWQWSNSGVAKEHPEYDLLPSEYFRRQIYGCFWFENDSLETALELYPNNMLYETDYPHPTCMHPGPQAQAAERPRDYAERVLTHLPGATLQRVFHDNAAALYRVT
jgi:predicted TIM-barrel fold metal-dependent hydrolase